MIRVLGKRVYSRQDYKELSKAFEYAKDMICNNCDIRFCDYCPKYQVIKDLGQASEYCNYISKN